MKALHFLCSTFALALIYPVAACAQEANSTILAANNAIGFAASDMLMNYQEHITPGPSDTESGWMPGFDIQLDNMNNAFVPNLYWAIHYQYASGNIHYLGSYMDGTPATGLDAATTNRVLAKFGIGIPWQSSVVVTPYLAGGYQDWQRNLLGTGGYDETYSAGLVGAGLLLQIAPTPRWVLGLDTELLAVVDGENTSTGLMPYPVPIAFGTSGEEKIGLQANYHLRGPWHFFAGTAFTHFNYTGGTNPSAGIEEPSSSTNQFATDVGVAYQY
ncbi:hypothetical protein [Acidithiobacillus sp. HP-11]|uniref:hypothetical protein n=1 Tax=Acidithiobacillus sp. HP-11 TaxID=2697656 RepID=UPI001879808E|nr:hypothetical protein [Acidithiobacillus sp. HP-11]MBE7566244.1 hypothetical protein [Acidithiobacillus sp. HP-11]